MYTHTHTENVMGMMACVCDPSSGVRDKRTERAYSEVILSSHRVSPGNRTQTVRVGSKHLYLQSHLVSPLNRLFLFLSSALDLRVARSHCCVREALEPALALLAPLLSLGTADQAPGPQG